MKELRRCEWAQTGDALMVAYHDTEWGVPLYDDRHIFEFLLLESFQTGLSWSVVLHKRRNFHAAFAGFNPAIVATFSQKDVAALLNDSGIIRNLAKIEAAIVNAGRCLEVKKEFGTFAAYMWGFVGGKPRMHAIRKAADRTATTPEALRWSSDLKKRGFRFLGPTTVYAHMQAVGMVNDHLLSCFRRYTMKGVRRV